MTFENRLRPIIEQASARAALLENVNKLLPDEVKIVSIYVDSMLKTRPIKQAAKTEAQS